MSDVVKEMAHRILIIDDNPNIQKDFETILVEEETSTGLNALRTEVFGEPDGDPTVESRYELDFASQGQEGCEKIRLALTEGRPYELAFVDMRMPPGWDGLETVEQLWRIDPDIQVSLYFITDSRRAAGVSLNSRPGGNLACHALQTEYAPGLISCHEK